MINYTILFPLRPERVLVDNENSAIWRCVCICGARLSAVMILMRTLFFFVNFHFVCFVHNRFKKHTRLIKYIQLVRLRLYEEFFRCNLGST